MGEIGVQQIAVGEIVARQAVMLQIVVGEIGVQQIVVREIVVQQVVMLQIVVEDCRSSRGPPGTWGQKMGTLTDP